MLEFVDRPLKRRSSREVELEREDYRLLVERHFRDAMTTLGWPRYVQSNVLLAAVYRLPVVAISAEAFKLHSVRVMGVLGWDRVRNPGAKDGRWRVAGENFYVYGKRPVKESKNMRRRLGRYLGW